MVSGDRKYRTAALKNMVVNRFQLNQKRNVGPTSESIRECQPRSKEEWADFHYQHVRPREHVDELGRRMYEKIQDEIIPALESITVDECIAYMHELVIDRAYEGYASEIEAVREVVVGELEGYEVLPTSDDVDQGLAVDFFIPAGQ